MRYGEVTNVFLDEGKAYVCYKTKEGALQAHYTTNHEKRLRVNGKDLRVTLMTGSN